jgi:hypothetical protein
VLWGYEKMLRWQLCSDLKLSQAAACCCSCVLLQAHGLQGYNGMLTHQDEGTWKAARRSIAPAFTISEVK